MKISWSIAFKRRNPCKLKEKGVAFQDMLNLRNEIKGFAVEDIAVFSYKLRLESVRHCCFVMK